MEIDEIAEKQKNKLIKEQKKLIRKYKEENQTLKNRWAKLKSILEKDMEKNQEDYEESLLPEFLNYSAEANWILERMEELEKTE